METRREGRLLPSSSPPPPPLPSLPSFGQDVPAEPQQQPLADPMEKQQGGRGKRIKITSFPPPPYIRGEIAQRPACSPQPANGRY